MKNLKNTALGIALAATTVANASETTETTTESLLDKLKANTEAQSPTSDLQKTTTDRIITAAEIPQMLDEIGPDPSKFTPEEMEKILETKTTFRQLLVDIYLAPSPADRQRAQEAFDLYRNTDPDFLAILELHAHLTKKLQKEENLTFEPHHPGDFEADVLKKTVGKDIKNSINRSLDIDIKMKKIAFALEGFDLGLLDATGTHELTNPDDRVRIDQILVDQVRQKIAGNPTLSKIADKLQISFDEKSKGRGKIHRIVTKILINGVDTGYRIDPRHDKACEIRPALSPDGTFSGLLFEAIGHDKKHFITKFEFPLANKETTLQVTSADRIRALLEQPVAGNNIYKTYLDHGEKYWDPSKVDPYPLNPTNP